MPALQEQLTQGLPLNAGNSIHGLAGTAAAITYTLFGAEVGPDHQVLNKVLAQGVLGTADGLVYAAPPHMNSAVTHLFLTNTTGSAVTGVAIGINGPASTAGNQLLPSLTIPANGSASFIDGVVRVNDASGNILQTAATPFGLTGLASIAAATAGIQNVETQVVGVTLPANFAAAGTTLAVEAYGTITSLPSACESARLRSPGTSPHRSPCTAATRAQ